MTHWPVSQRRRRLIAALPLAACAMRNAASGEEAKPDQAANAAKEGEELAVRNFRFTTSDGVRLNVLEAKPSLAPPGVASAGVPSEARSAKEGGPVIVLVPGWCMPATIWQAQLQALGQRYRTLALDPRGQGDSEIPAAGYDAQRRADDLRELLAPLPRVVLVGWSLGVLDALNLVDRFGDSQLAGLVLVDNSVGEPPAPRPSKFISDLRADRAATVERFVRGMFAKPRAEGEIEHLKQAALRMPLEAAIALLSYPFPREHWRNIARSFAKPLCYCVTSHYVEQARNLQRERPATRVEWFEHAGHALFVDEPERFNRIVDQFAQTA
ncbi:MAG TPA: alpha/beta hydrolase [Burkholderiaceae bacterium]|nr:alpha/beta hydrolase [Burkholderiaceae bacterium]